MFIIILVSFAPLLSVHGAEKKVLFIGNSYSENVPWLVHDIASSTGDNLIYGSNTITVGGYSLYRHSSEPNTLSLIRQGGWDIVVLQDHSRYPSEPLSFVEEYVYPYAHFLKEEAQSYSTNAEIMFYMTWGRRDGDADRCPENPQVCTYIGMDNLIRERYMIMAESNNASISPVSAVWRYIRKNYPSIELYHPDGSHPSDAGFYAAACCFYTAIFKKDPMEITFNYNLNSTDANRIKTAAKLVVLDSLSKWHLDKEYPDIEKPTVPTNLSSGNITSDGFTLSWSASTDNVAVTGYDVYRNGTYLKTVSSTSSDISGLSAGTTYSMTVRAKDAAGNISDPSAALSVRTKDAPDLQAPSIPTGLAASNISPTSFSLTWTASTDNVGVTGYDVFCNGTLTSSVSSTSSTIIGLSAASTYSMTVKAKDAAGNISEPSAPLNVTTLSAPDTEAPSTPTNLHATNITATGFTLGWNESTDNIGVTGYDVYLNGNLARSVTATYANITGLTSGSTYTMTVRAKDAAGNLSALSQPFEITTPDNQPPSIPSGLTATNVTQTGFILNWSASTDNVGVTGYDVYLNGTLYTSVTGVSATISGLTASTSYAMTVRAKDAAGNISSASNVFNVTTANPPDTQAPSVPTGLNSVNITETSFTLTWSPSTDNIGVTAYDVYRNSILFSSVTTNSALISGLTVATTYTMTVRARDAAGNISSSSSPLNVTTIDTHPPTIPTGLTASEVSETGFRLSWSASSDNVGVAGYVIYQGSTFISTVTGTSASISGLSAGTTYQMTVRARDAAGNISPASQVLSVLSADNHPPSVPAGLAPENIAETSFRLSWTASTDNVAVTGYDVYRNGNLFTTVSGTSANITGLTPSTSYSMAVRARDAANNVSGLSSQLNVTTIDTHAPSIPSGLTATNITETSFTLSWSASSDNVGVTGYDVYLDGTLINTLTATSMNVSGLHVWTTYSLTVRAKDAAGNISSSSSALSVTTADNHPPTVPANLVSGNITETGFILSWTASSDNVGVTSYEVYRNGSLAATVTGTSANITGLLPSRTYSMTVRAVDATENRSAASSPLSVTTIDTHPPSIPAGLVATGVTETSFTLSWSASSDNVGVTGYDIYCNGVLSTSVNGITASFTGLTLLTNYSMTIRAKDAAGNISNHSNALVVRTPDTHAPTVPTNLVATKISETSFTLSWSASTDNSSVAGYDIYRNGNLFTSVTGTSAIISGLSPASTYSMSVRAKDASGNISPLSDALRVNTNDTHPPSVPANLKASNLSETSLTLNWSPSTDNVGVSKYEVYCNDILLATTTTSKADISGLTVFTDYNLTVRAFDAAGNVSAFSQILKVKTPDLHPPTAPENLSVKNLQNSGFSLYWTPSTDNVGVSGYEIYCNDMPVITLKESEFLFVNLSDPIKYEITIVAVDESGNTSDPSLPFIIKLADYFPLTKEQLGSIVIYPVPVRGNEFYVDLGREFIGEMNLVIYSLKGTILYQQKVHCSGEILTISNPITKNGMYLLSIGNNITRITRTIIINRE